MEKKWHAGFRDPRWMHEVALSVLSGDHVNRILYGVDAYGIK